jgi:hypothetical protein
MSNKRVETYLAATKKLDEMTAPEPRYVWLDRGDSGAGESCWTDEDGVQHWKVWRGDEVREFTRKT